MTTLPLTLTKIQKKITVTFNQDRFERLADNLGFFSNDFLQSLTRAENDIRHGRLKKLRSLRDLRQKKI